MEVSAVTGQNLSECFESLFQGIDIVIYPLDICK